MDKRVNKRPNSAFGKASSANRWSKINRPTSAVSSGVRQSDTKLIFGKSDTPTLGAARKISSKKENRESRPRNLGSLGFYLDQSNFGNDSAKKAEASHLTAPDVTTIDYHQASRGTIRRSLPRKNISVYRTDNGYLLEQDMPSLTLESTHLFDPHFLQSLRNTSYAFPSRATNEAEVESGAEVEDDDISGHNQVQDTVVKPLSSLSECNWRTVTSSTIYPYHRSYRLLTDEPISFAKGLEAPTVVNPKPPKNVVAIKRFDYTDEVDMYAEEDAKFKKSFRDRFRSVVNSIYRENYNVESPLVGHSEHGVGLETGMLALKQSGDKGDRDGNGEHNDSEFSLEMPHNATVTPREAIIRESISRRQIPFVLRELLEAEEVEEVTTIDLSGKGVGDEKMCCLVRSLPCFKNVEEILIGENRLTDRSIQPFLRTIFSQLSVRVLDISANKLDSMSIDMLKAYLVSPGCSLIELRLRKSDVDDSECAEMVASFIVNKSLQTVNLSENLIGVKEDLNVVQPDFETGAEAIADMLLQNRCLTELDVSWNSIRGESAITLGQSVSQNNTLRYLNLAYNNIGDEGAQHLAHSLRFNVSLENIDVSYNNLTPRTALVFSQVLCENHAVIRLNFNGNCAGRTGSKALLRAVRIAAVGGRILKINLDKANILFVDDTFDRTNPSGDYTLDVSDTYGYTVACILCEIANTKPDAKFTKVRIGRKNKDKKSLPAGSKLPPPYRWQPVKLIRGPSAAETQQSVMMSLLCDLGIRPADYVSGIPLPPSTFNASCGESKERAALRKFCINFELYPEDNILDDLLQHLQQVPLEEKAEVHMVLKQIFIRAFEIIWNPESNVKSKPPIITHSRSAVSRSCSITDDDYMMSIEETAKVLELFGWQNISCSRYFYDMAFKIIKTADVFSTEKVTRSDFVRYMFLHYTDMYAAAPGPLLDDKTGCPWVVPTKGILDISFVCSSMPPSIDSLVTEDAIRTMTKAMRPTVAVTSSMRHGQKRGYPSPQKQPSHACAGTAESAHGREMLKNTVIDEDFHVSCDQAETLLAEFLKYDATPVSHLIEMLLPQLATSRDACRFLAANLKFDQLISIKFRMENAFRVITGVSGGHYSLDLSKKMDRLAARKLSEHCNLEKAKRLASKYGFLNTSQTGDNDSFRNASFNGKPIILTSTWFDEIPDNGKLRFDYVNMDRPIEGLEPVSQHSFNKILHGFLFADDSTTVTGSSDESDDDMSGDEGPTPFIRKGKPTHAQKRNELTQFLQALKQTSANQIYEKAMQEQAKVMWQSTVQSSWSKYTESHTKYLLEKISESKRQILAKKGKDGVGFSDELEVNAKPAPVELSSANKLLAEVHQTQAAAKALAASNESKNLHNLAIYSLIYREARLRPVHMAEVFFSMASANKAMVPKINFPTRSNRKRSTLRRSSNFLTDGRALLEVDWCLVFESVIRSLEVLLVYQVYFSVVQIEAIVNKFLNRNAPTVVTARALQMMFPRIVDLENMPLLVNKLPNDLKEELFHRVGVLNIWNPIHMDGEYKFDLASWDQREAAKMALKLVTLERGENMFHNQKFIPSAVEDEAPGWVLPYSWTTEGFGAEAIAATGYQNPPVRAADDASEGKLPRHGTLIFTFTTDPAKINIEERIAMAEQRTLALYRGRFIDGFSKILNRQPRIVHQSAVKFAGTKLRRLTNSVRKKVSVSKQLRYELSSAMLAKKGEEAVQRNCGIEEADEDDEDERQERSEDTDDDDD